MFGESWRCFLFGVVINIAAADDYVTLRYYGRYEGRFGRTKNWPKKSPYGPPAMDEFTPTEVCGTFMAVCVNMKLNQCVKAPPEFRAPWTRDFTGRDPGRRIFDPPYESEPGTYMMIADVDPLYERSTTDHEPRQLFSGCDAGCNDCRQGHGNALHPVRLPSMCFVTENAGVFALLYNHNTSLYKPANTESNCVDSLVDYYDEIEEANSQRQLITGLVCGACALILAAVTVFIVCRVRKRRQGMEEELMRAIREGHAQFNVGQGPLLGQSQIEANFPVKYLPTVEGAEPITCVVCLSPILADQAARELQCNHHFHAECILSWWMHRPRRVIQCPLCQRQQVVAGVPEDTCTAPTAGTDGETNAAQLNPQVIGADHPTQPTAEMIHRSV